MLAIEATHESAFLADLHAARLQALSVLRSVLALATLAPDARAALFKADPKALSILRESRLAAAQILQLPLPEGGGRGVGSSDTAPPITPSRTFTSPPTPTVQTPRQPNTRATGSPHDHPHAPPIPNDARPPTAHLAAHPRQPVPAPPSRPAPPPPPIQHIIVDHPAPPLIRRAPPTQTARLLARTGAAP